MSVPSLSKGFKLTVIKGNHALFLDFLSQVSQTTGLKPTWKDMPLWTDWAGRPHPFNGYGDFKSKGRYAYLKTEVKSEIERGIHKAILFAGTLNYSYSFDYLDPNPTFADDCLPADIHREFIIEPADDGQCLDWLSLASVYDSTIGNFRLLWIPEYHSFLTLNDRNEWGQGFGIPSYFEMFFKREGQEDHKPAFPPESPKGTFISNFDDGNLEGGRPYYLAASEAVFFYYALVLRGLKRPEALPGFLFSFGEKRLLKADPSIGIEGKPILDFLCIDKTTKLFLWSVITDKSKNQMGHHRFLNDDGSLSPFDFFESKASNVAFDYEGKSFAPTLLTISNMWKLAGGQAEYDEKTQDLVRIFFSFDSGRSVICDREGHATFLDWRK